MTETRDFDAEFDLAKREPLRFKLAGQEFETKGWISPLALQRDTDKDYITNIKNFYSRVLVPESRERFISLLDDPDVMIDAKQLDTIGGWILTEVSANRPTEQPVSSGNGASPT